jgi:hypothetical protein
MITLDEETAAKLLALPVTQTLGFKLEDREFIILDKENFHWICELANVGIVPNKLAS